MNDIGLHLPIYADVTVSFKYWMNPAPDQQFLKILNTEIFGDSTPTSNNSSQSNP